MDHKLLIEPKFKTKVWLFFLNTKKPVQHREIKVGVHILNINDVPFSGAKLQNIRWGLANQSITYQEVCPFKYDIKKLNPKEGVSLWLDGFIPLLDGSYGINMNVTPAVEGDIILVSSFDEFNKRPCTPLTNSWYKLFYVRNVSNIIHNRTNLLLLTIAIITLLEQLYGMKNVVTFFKTCIASFFYFIGGLFN